MLVTGHDSAEAQYPGKEAFDVPATSVTPQLSPILGLGLTVRTVGRDQLDATLGKLRIEPIAIVRLVADELVRQLLYESRVERFEDELRFMTFTARNPDGDRKAMAVCHCHDLGRFAAASDSNRKAPLFAPAWLPSM